MAELNRFEDLKEFWHGRDDYFTSDNLYVGKTGERILYSALSMKFRKSDGCKITHNPFNDQYKYACSHGLDLTLETPEFTVAIEAKNLNLKPKPYGTKFVYEKVLPRFVRVSPKMIKILIITYIELLTKKALRLLSKMHIHVFETRQFLTIDIYKKENLKQLYSLSNNLKNFIYEAQQPIQPEQPQQIQLIVQPNKTATDFFGVVSYGCYGNTQANQALTTTNKQLQYDTVTTQEQLKLTKQEQIDLISDIEKTINNYHADSLLIKYGLC